MKTVRQFILDYAKTHGKFNKWIIMGEMKLANRRVTRRTPLQTITSELTRLHQSGKLECVKELGQKTCYYKEKV